ncbi:hypothetical protein HOY80DRAFT_1038809 [Tuber brumale]|nr:hypothetical protein HOY80DRAFT_1038809 [Tuber brumale]
MKFVRSLAFLVSATSSTKNGFQDSNGSGFVSSIRNSSLDQLLLATMIRPWSGSLGSDKCIPTSQLIGQTKKVRSNMALEAKKAAEVTNRSVAPPAPVTATASLLGGRQTLVYN